MIAADLGRAVIAALVAFNSDQLWELYARWPRWPLQKSTDPWAACTHSTRGGPSAPAPDLHESRCEWPGYGAHGAPLAAAGRQ